MVGEKGPMEEAVLSCGVSDSEIKSAPRCAHASAQYRHTQTRDGGRGL